MSNFKRKTANGYESIPINADKLGGMTLEQIQGLISGKVDSTDLLTSLSKALTAAQNNKKGGFLKYVYSVNTGAQETESYVAVEDWVLGSKVMYDGSNQDIGQGTLSNYLDELYNRIYNLQNGDSIPQATSSKFGGIKTGYSESNKNYAVKLDADGKAYVSVPWTSSGYTLPDATSDTKGGVKAYFGATSGGEWNFELYADIQQSNNTLYIRAGQFKQTSGSASSATRFTFKRAMSTMGGSASSVAVILGDSYGQSTNGGHMGSLAVDGSSYTGFSYRASNGEKGHVYYIAIGRW